MIRSSLTAFCSSGVSCWPCCTSCATTASAFAFGIGLLLTTATFCAAAIDGAAASASRVAVAVIALAATWTMDRNRVIGNPCMDRVGRSGGCGPPHAGSRERASSEVGNRIGVGAGYRAPVAADAASSSGVSASIASAWMAPRIKSDSASYTRRCRATFASPAKRADTMRTW